MKLDVLWYLEKVGYTVKALQGLPIAEIAAH